MCLCMVSLHHHYYIAHTLLQFYPKFWCFCMNSQASKLVSIESPNCIFEQYEVIMFVFIFQLVSYKDALCQVFYSPLRLTSSSKRYHLYMEFGRHIYQGRMRMTLGSCFSSPLETGEKVCPDSATLLFGVGNGS